MNAKTLVIAGALTLGLLAPAGTAVAATTDDRPNPLGGVLGIFGDHDNQKKDRKHDRKARNKHVSQFKISGTIRSVDRDDRTFTVGGGDNRRTIKVAEDAKIWREFRKAKFGDLERGDDVKVTGEKRNGKYVADRVWADD